GGGIGGEEENLLNTVFAKEDKKWIAQLEAGEFVELYVHPNLERLMKKLLSSCGFEQDPSWKENQMVFSSLL
ncbi:sit4 phosphatase-associated protein, partial [Cystoisospora suis]